MARVVERTIEAVKKRLTNTLTPPKAEELLAAWEVEAEQSRLAARAGHAAAITDNTAQILAVIDKHAPRAAAAVEKISRAEAALNQAREEHASLEGEHRRALWPLERAVDRAKAELYSTASPLIRELGETLQGEVEQTSSQRDAVQEKNIAGRLVVLWSNADSVSRRIDAIFATRQEMSNWHLQPWSDDEIRKRFDECRAAWPAVEERPEQYRPGAA